MNCIERYDIYKLRQPDTVKAFTERIINKFDENTDNAKEKANAWSTCRQVLTEAAKEILKSDNHEKRRKQWYDDECREITMKKNEAYAQMINKHYTRNAVENYRDIRRQEKRLFKAKKRAFIEEIHQNIEENNTKNESRKFYRTVNNLRRDFKPTMMACRDINGEILNNRESIKRRWHQHFDQLLNEGNISIQEQQGESTVNYEVCGSDTDIDPPSRDEISQAISNLKNNRARGPDSINAEILKVCQPILIERLYVIIGEVWNTEEIPKEWEEHYLSHS